MKNESRPQKTNISVMKRVFSIIIVAVILTGIIFINADSYYIYDIPFYSGNANDNASMYNSGIKVGTNIYGRMYSFVDVNQGVNYGVCAVLIEENTYRIYFLSKEAQTTSQNIKIVTSNDGGNTFRNENYSGGNMILDQNTQVYYLQYGNSLSVLDGDILGYYNSLDDALAAYEAGNSGSGGTSSYTLNYNLPAGNIAYIEFNNDFDSFILKTTMPTTSYIVGSSLWDTTQTYGFASALPSGSLSIPSTIIPWQRDGALSITGVTNKAVFDYGPHHPSSGNYLVICNPAYYGGTANGPYEFLNNGSIQIQAENVVDIKVYQLNSNLAPIPGSNDRLDVTTEGTGVVYEPTFDPETGELVWPDNQEPVVGGGNLTVSSEDGFKSFLANLVERIKGIFEPAHDAIQTLATAVSNFATTLRALYMWLPSPVLNILTSAIMLAITIGVIKVFL